jgi:hypothetical protein
MRSTLAKLLVGLLAFVLTNRQASAAIILSLEPASQTVSAGSPVSMDLVVSNSNPLVSAGVGAFDVDLTYNPAVLSAMSVTFGTHLDLGVSGSIQNSNLSTPGLIHLDEVSLEASSELLLNQPASFTLATLNFSGTAPGVSSVNFTSAILSDVTGLQSITPETVAGQVEVTGGGVAVPDPASTANLLPLGLLGIWMLRRSR